MRSCRLPRIVSIRARSMPGAAAAASCSPPLSRASSSCTRRQADGWVTATRIFAELAMLSYSRDGCSACVSHSTDAACLPRISAQPASTTSAAYVCAVGPSSSYQLQAACEAAHTCMNSCSAFLMWRSLAAFCAAAVLSSYSTSVCTHEQTAQCRLWPEHRQHSAPAAATGLAHLLLVVVIVHTWRCKHIQAIKFHHYRLVAQLGPWHLRTETKSMQCRHGM